MTVQQLIDYLMTIEDKEMRVAGRAYIDEEFGFEIFCYDFDKHCITIQNGSEIKKEIIRNYARGNFSREEIEHFKPNEKVLVINVSN